MKRKQSGLLLDWSFTANTRSDLVAIDETLKSISTAVSDATSSDHVADARERQSFVETAASALECFAKSWRAWEKLNMQNRMNPNNHREHEQEYRDSTRDACGDSKGDGGGTAMRGGRIRPEKL